MRNRCGWAEHDATRPVPAKLSERRHTGSRCQPHRVSRGPTPFLPVKRECARLEPQPGPGLPHPESGVLGNQGPSLVMRDSLGNGQEKRNAPGENWSHGPVTPTVAGVASGQK